jgi:hypothetical protein
MTGARRLVCSLMANAEGDEVICLLQAGLAAEIEEQIDRRRRSRISLPV